MVRAVGKVAVGGAGGGIAPRLARLAVPPKRGRGLRRKPAEVTWSREATAAAAAIAGLRTLFGLAAYLAPGAAGRPWIGAEQASRKDTAVILRALAGRDLALGLGALLALRSGRHRAEWVAAGALSDTGDTLATLVGMKHLPRLGRLAVLASCAGAAATGWFLACRHRS